MGISLNIKIGDKRTPDDPAYLRDWRSGQIIDIRPMGYYDKCTSSRVFNAIIDVPNIDFEELRGTLDWKSEYYKVYDNWKKYLVPVDSAGKYPWDFGYNIEEKSIRKRGWFIDFKELLELGVYTQDVYDAIIDLHRRHPGVIYNGDIFQLFRHEDTNQRIISHIKNQPWSTGTKTIGAAGDATDLADAETKTAATLTGNLTWEHLGEETTLSGTTPWDLDTDGHLLKITAASGAENDGDAYEDQVGTARVNFGTFDYLEFEEASAGTFDDLEVSKFSIDASGNGNRAIRTLDGGDSGRWTVNRMLIKGSVDAVRGIEHTPGQKNILLTNNIIYGIGDGAGEAGINVEAKDDCTVEVYNNTLIGNDLNFHNSRADSSVGLIIKNNLCQNAGTTDFSQAGAGYGTTAKNVSEDTTSPDVAYRSKDVHTNSVFKDYANDDYRLDSGGDATNLAILDDGEDLSGTFTDDIEGQTRATWYIGASEIVAVDGVAPTGAFYGPLVGPMGGPI